MLSLKYIQSLTTEIVAQPETIEAAWDLVCTLHDISHTNRVGSIRNTAPVEPTVDTIDAKRILGITGQVGLQCPKCLCRDVSYTLYANRSADEGMSSNCVCRTCRHCWRLHV